MTKDLPRLDLYTLTVAAPRRAGDFAERAERVGWDGMAVVDSQNLSGDVYVALTIAASRTERLGLATAVTNPVTRHPAVTASAIASVHAFSNGRATLGIGRGDSSLAHLGRAPASVGVFASYLDALQTFLRGESVSSMPCHSTNEWRPMFRLLDSQRLPSPAASPGCPIRAQRSKSTSQPPDPR